MSWKFFVARRYLRGTQTSRGISAQSIIGVSGVTLGVAALLIVQAVMAGFTEKLKEQMLGALPHVVVALSSRADPTPEEIENWLKVIRETPGVEGATPYFVRDAMLARDESVVALRLAGVEPKSVSEGAVFPRRMKVGSFENLDSDVIKGVDDPLLREELRSNHAPRVVIGYELAASFDLTVGSEIQIVCPLCGIGPLGPVPTVRRFVVAGIFKVGNAEQDSDYVFTHIDEARRFFHPEGDAEPITGIYVRVHDVEQADTIVAQIHWQLLDAPLWITDWKARFGSLFDALKLEKLALFVVLLIIVLVAAFNIAGMEILFVREKTHDIAILKAMGAPGKAVTRVFLSKGAVVGVVGTLMGLVLGLGLCWVQHHFGLIHIDASVYQMKYMPILVQPTDVIAVILAPTLITTLAAYFPARRAGKLVPAEALRSE